MASLVRSLDAHQYLRATMTADSWRAGWRSLLLRAYVDPVDAEEFTTPPTADHLIVLVTEGECKLEGLYRGRWRTAHYSAGVLGMTAPGEEVTLRWRGETAHKTLQLHLPSSVIHDALTELSLGDPKNLEMPHQLLATDPLVEQVMRGLADAMAAGAPDCYAETAASFLAVHLLTRHGNFRAATSPSRDDRRLRRVEAFMRENLDAPLSLAEMAQQAGVSRFHLLRIFKDAHGETPVRRLTRMRMEEAQRRLKRGGESISEIAFACGYGNPAHFASAFRRVVGMPPREYRRASA